MSATKPSQPSPQPPGFSRADHNQVEDHDPTDGLTSSVEQFPSLGRTPSFQYIASLHPLDIAASQAHSTIASHATTPLSADLRLETGNLEEQEKRGYAAASVDRFSAAEALQQTNFNAGLPVRSSSIRSVLGSRARRSDSLSPASAISSPAVGPLADMTPLPSPISAWGMPGSGRTSIESDVDEEDTVAGQTRDSPPEPIHFVRTSPKKRRIPDSLEQIYNANAAAHARNRSLSEYVPEGMQIPRSRNIVVSTSGAPSIGPSSFSPPKDDHMHRERYLAVQRGLAISIPNPPTPPDSNQGKDSDEFESIPTASSALKDVVPTIYEAYMVRGGKLKKWRALRQLGKGTFSRVMLATSERLSETGDLVDQSNIEDRVNPKSLVAVKVCQKGPAGGADEEKIQTSIRRETQLMKCIHHPSLVQLKAVNEGERQTYLVLNYCAGGDLFELANSDLSTLTPNLIRRIFAELVSAVRYLHEQYIVHRDIKLENVLVNLPTAAFHTISDWQAYQHPVVTLTDLGLGRNIPRPPESPLLTTRCGSEDYAAPEVLMAQEYDGRSTDSWALGVLLYAIMEGRLPFDPVPGARRKSPTSHRIARCEWQWVKWADDDGEWDSVKGSKLNGAREVVEGLIARKRSRWNLEKVQKTEWVARGILVDGDLRREEDDYEDK